MMGFLCTACFMWLEALAWSFIEWLGLFSFCALRQVMLVIVL